MKRESTQVPTGPTGETPSLTIIERIAALEETDPVDLPPLYDAVDPEAVDSFVDSSTDVSQPAKLRFSYYGYDIHVRSDGDIGIAA